MLPPHTLLDYIQRKVSHLHYSVCINLLYFQVCFTILYPEISFISATLWYELLIVIAHGWFLFPEPRMSIISK